jgi:hypothetical protein
MSNNEFRTAEVYFDIRNSTFDILQFDFFTRLLPSMPEAPGELPLPASLKI